MKEVFGYAWSRVRRIQRHNISVLRQRPLQEISGAFGDLGTLFPIFVALAEAGSISVSSTLVFSGLANILTGIVFGIPLPVQPMKAIAAVAIARHYSQPQLGSAGLFVAAIIGFLSVTGLVKWFTRVIPLPVVKGIQVGTGLSLMMSVMRFLPTPDILIWNDCLAFLAVLVFLFFCSLYPRTPFVLVIIVVTIPLIFPFRPHYLFGDPQLSIWKPAAFIPSFADFRYGAVNAGLGQIPLTTLNSIVAVTYLATDLVPEVPTPSATAIGISVTTMNLVGCWFGAMPVCHGSGGLASQYRFGARSGASVVIFGLIKLLLGLFAAEYAVAYFHGFSRVPLGVMLFLAGLELARMGESLNTEGARDLWQQDDRGLDASIAKQARSPTADERTRRWTVMLVTVGALLAAANDGVGFVAGLLVHGAYKLLDWIEDKRAMREGHIRIENDTLRQEPEALLSASPGQ